MDVPTLGARARPARLVHFPLDRSLGDLYVRPQGVYKGALSASPWERMGVWHRLGRARTDVVLPAASDVLLDVAPEAVDLLPALTTLRADDLQAVDLEGTGIDDAGLANLAHLRGLHALHAGEADVDDAVVGTVLRFPRLEELSLAGTRVTDEGLERLAGLPCLRDLDLSDTAVTDAGLVHVAGMTQLRRLRLANTELTDDAVEHLSALRLRQLDVRGTHLSFVAVTQLKQALPGCTILRFP